MLLRGALILLAVAVIIWLLSARSRAAKSPRSMRQPEAFLRCAHCGVHLPHNEAVVERGLAYCSEAHRLAGPREQGGS